MMNYLSCGIKNVGTIVSFVLSLTVHAFDGQTDGQKGLRNTVRLRLHVMQRMVLQRRPICSRTVKKLMSK